MKRTTIKPLILIIFDGWGYSPHLEYNAIAQAHTPTWDYLWAHCPHTLLMGSGQAVGLPLGQMGNSEVGHMHLGAGRLIYQDYTRINHTIDSGEFLRNPIFIEAFNRASQSNRAVHVMGLLSPGGVHSHQNHLFALLELAALYQVKKLYFHVFLDGRDTPPKSAEPSLRQLEDLCNKLECGKIATVSGRYYAMDRDQRWPRIKLAYDAIVQGIAPYKAPSAQIALEMAYERGESDEFIKPTVMIEDHVIYPGIQQDDIGIFMNFRADRARQLTTALLKPTFEGFDRESNSIPLFSEFISLADYNLDLPLTAAFPPEKTENTFGEYISQQGLSQLRIAETEKYAHVTYFFNGGVETVFPREDRILIPSPQIATYDLQPEMSAQLLTQEILTSIYNKTHDVIICNYANADMVGHSGNFVATCQAIEYLDRALQEIVHACDKSGGEMIITADHGNAECMYDVTTSQAHTAHTNFPVPFVYKGRAADITLEHGTLCDVAPTLLYLLDLPKPKEMTGQSLLKFKNDHDK